MYNCPTFFLFWKCIDDMSYWTNLYRTVADNQLHFFTISNMNYTVFVSLAHIHLRKHIARDMNIKIKQPSSVALTSSIFARRYEVDIRRLTVLNIIASAAVFTAGEVVFTGFCGDYRSIGTQQVTVSFTFWDQTVAVAEWLMAWDNLTVFEATVFVRS